MAAKPPLWRQLYDGVEQRIAPKLETLVQTGPFADVTAVSTRVQREARKEFERRSAQLLHLWNLPAGTDVVKVREQIGRLERQVRELSQQLEEHAQAEERRQPGSQPQPEGRREEGEGT